MRNVKDWATIVILHLSLWIATSDTKTISSFGIRFSETCKGFQILEGTNMKCILCSTMCLVQSKLEERFQPESHGVLVRNSDKQCTQIRIETDQVFCFETDFVDEETMTLVDTERAKPVSLNKDAGKKPTEIANQLGVSRPTVYCALIKSETVDRKVGSGRKMKLDVEEIKEAAKVDPLKEMRKQPKDLSVSDMTICRTIKKASGKSLMRERQLLTPAMKETLLHCCKALLQDLKKAKANYPDMTVVFQQDGAPAHTSKKAQKWLESNMLFWPRKLWSPYLPDANPLDFTFWVHVEPKGCTICHPNIDALKTAVTQHWDARLADSIRAGCQASTVALRPLLIKGGYIKD
ncbi:uncharacterized protein LOC131891933 isoform X6 [Tigriopus californicus]|uniref:uncharacterized protein LOC131891933 isoform X6 n=1 Tax=Tigriopus californicus TaxID=6832 RepID=UPI0027DA27ED|nr:uncharacterized protein LOC131891933 isoform X6 [Tigriopus californicus]